MQLLTYIFSAQMTFCDWQLSGRIWRPSVTCTVDSTRDLAIYGSNTVPVTAYDTTVLTVAGLAKEESGDDAFYQLVDVGPNGVVKNTFMVVNVSITLDQDVQNVYSSIFGSFQGVLDNVTITGFVNFTVPEHNELTRIYLSTLIGNARTGLDKANYAHDYTGAFSLRNVSTGLRYFINGIEVGTDLSINAIQITKRNCLDSEQISNLGTFTTELSSMKQLHMESYDFTDSIAMTEFKIYTWFGFPIRYENDTLNNDYVNILEDMYPVRLKLSLEKNYETEGMMIRRFDASNNELLMANEGDANIALTIYQEDTKAVAVKDGKLIICRGDLVYDILSSTCITRSSCLTHPMTKYIFQSTCVSACPDGFFTHLKACWFECPLWLGAVQEPGQQACKTPCSGQITTKAGSCSNAAACIGYVFGGGCFDFCPPGTITPSSGNICTQPSNELACSGDTPYWLRLSITDPQRFYDYCASEAPTWMYKINATNQYKALCSNGVTLLGRRCIEDNLTPPEMTENSCPIKDVNDCRTTCLNTILQEITPSSDTCSDKCNSYNYQNSVLGLCHLCLSDTYDGGTYFHRATKACVPTCTKWSKQTYNSFNIKICEDESPDNCQTWVWISDTNMECVSECPSSGSIYRNEVAGGTQCQTSCPSGSYPDRLTNVCNKNCQFLNLSQINKCETPGSDFCPRVLPVQGQLSPFSCVSSCQLDQFVVRPGFTCAEYVPFIKAQCGEMLKSGLWMPMQTCGLNGKLDQMNQGIINVAGLVKEVDGEKTLYSVLDIDEYGILQNSQIIMNVRMTITDPQTYVSIFGQVAGRLENVSVTGFINITTDLSINTLHLSRMLGFVSTIGDRTVNSTSDTWILKNVSSGVRYFVNDVEIINDMQMIQGKSLRLTNCLDQFTGGSNIIIDLQSGFTYDTFTFSGNKLIATDYVFHQHQVAEELAMVIYSNSALSTLDFKMKYAYPFAKYLENMNIISKMSAKYYSSSGTESTLSQAAVIVYFDEFKAKSISINPDKPSIFCEGSALYDTASNTCISQSSCVSFKKSFKQLCVDACPANTQIIDNVCYTTCPLHLKYALNSSGACVKCAGGYFGSINGCVNVCPAGQIPVMISGTSETLGCSSSCPTGFVLSGSNCIIPKAEADCPDQYFIQTNDIRYSNYCSLTIPSSVFKFLSPTTRTYSNTISHSANLQNELKSPLPSCDTNINSASNQLTPVMYNMICRLICGNGFYDDENGNCAASCSEFKTKSNYEFGLCAYCPDDQFLNYSSKLCIGSCTSYKIVDGHKICYVAGQLPQCPFVNNNQMCVDQCYDQGEYKFVTSGNPLCVNSCPYFYSRDGATQVLTCQPTCLGVRGIDATYHNSLQRCETACSMFSTIKFTKDNLCQDQCDSPKPYFIGGNICVSQCHDQSILKFLNEGSNACVSTCTFGSYYRNNADQFLFCTPATCAAANFTGVDSYHATYSRCENSCSLFQTLSFIDGQTCLLACQSPRQFYDDNKNCMATCPSAYPYAETNNKCVALCTTKNYEVRVQTQPKICLSATVCPLNFITNTSNSNSKQCVTTCDQVNKYLHLTECLVKCPDDFSFIKSSTENTCQNFCSPTNYWNVSGTLTCEPLADCPYGFVLNTTLNYKMCRSACPKFRTADNVCVDSCTFVDETEQVCKSACGPIPNGFQTKELFGAPAKVCLGGCAFYGINADAFEGTLPCMPSCVEPNKFFEQNNQCTAQCASKMYYIPELNKYQCISNPDQCTFYVMVDGQKECYDECPDNAKFIDGQECKTTCDFYYSNNGLFYCTSMCTNLYTKDANGKLECSDACKASYDFLDGKECKLSCPFYKTNGASLSTCMASCPQFFQLDANSNKQCLTSCATTQFIKNSNECVDTCSYYSWNGAYKICLQSCAGFWAMFSADNVVPRCESSCSAMNLPNYLSTSSPPNQCVPGCGSLIQESLTSTKCVSSCSSPNLYNDTQNSISVCVSTCVGPKRLDANLNRCDESCYYKIVNGNNICTSSKTSCDADWFEIKHNSSSTECTNGCLNFVSGVQCLSSCPSGMYSVDQLTGKKNCVSGCPSPNVWAIDPVYHNITKRCESSCAKFSSLPFVNNGQCVASCSSNIYIDATKACQADLSGCVVYSQVDVLQVCLDACPTGQVSDLKKCQGSCPDPARKFIETTRACSSACASQTYNASFYCQSSCGSKFVKPDSGAKMCVDQCQASGQNFYTWDGTMKICTDTCDNFWRIDPTKDAAAKWCEASCAALGGLTYYLESKECVSSCPAAFQFLDGLVCKATCPYVTKQQFTTISTYKCQTTPCAALFEQILPGVQNCVSDCLGVYKYKFGTECVQQCSITTSKYIDVDGKTCAATCSGEKAISTDLLSCDTNCMFYVSSGQNLCTASCPSTSPYQNLYSTTNGNRFQCVSACANTQYIETAGVKQCQACSPLYEVVKDANTNADVQKCLSQCKPEQVQYDNRCYSGVCKDLGALKYNDNKICKNTCGTQLVADAIVFQCVASCPTSTLYAIADNEMLCVQTCGANQRVTSKFHVGNADKCVDKCPIGTFEEAKICVDACASNMYQVIDSEYVCVSVCNFYVPQQGLVKQCYDKCEDAGLLTVMSLASPKLCVSSCPSDYQFISALNSSQCVASCDNSGTDDSNKNYYYSNTNGVKTCLPSCSTNTSKVLSITNYFECKGTCAAQEFLEESVSGTPTGQCVNQCPSGFNEENKVCVVLCPTNGATGKQYYKEIGTAKQCLAQCTSDYPREVVSGNLVKCLTLCTTPPYQDLSGVCVNACPAGSYLQGQKCVAACSAPQIYAQLVVSGVSHYVCQTQCTDNIFELVAGVYICGSTCDKLTRVTSSGKIECTASCGPSEYEHSDKVCNSTSCAQESTTYKFSDNRVCVQNCNEKFVMKATLECSSECSGSAAGYISQTIMGITQTVCYAACPTPFLDNHNLILGAGKCVDICDTSKIQYHAPISGSSVKECVDKCYDAVRFVQTDKVTCDATCASQIFKIDSAGNHVCSDSCAMPLGYTPMLGIKLCASCQFFVSDLNQSCLGQTDCNYYDLMAGQKVCRINSDGSRNEALCPMYTNDAAPFLCIQSCAKLSYLDWCVGDCGVTPFKFAPEFGTVCKESCEAYHQKMVVLSVSQQKCVPTCDYMVSSADPKECQPVCESLTTLFVKDRTYCMNCGADLKLVVQAGPVFTCESACPAGTTQSGKICSAIPCDGSTMASNTAYVCEAAQQIIVTTQTSGFSTDAINAGDLAYAQESVIIASQNATVFGWGSNQNNVFNTQKAIASVTSLHVEGAMKTLLLAGPPTFDGLLSYQVHQNKSLINTNRSEIMQLEAGETFVDFFGFYDPDVNETSNKNINYMLTNQALYFRGSCQSGLCGRSSEGAFETIFAGMPYIYGTWTKIDLAASGFTFGVSDIDKVETHEWALLFHLKDGKKFAYGQNNYNRMCELSRTTLSIKNLSIYDQVFISENATVLSDGSQLYYCGPQMSQTDFVLSPIEPSASQLVRPLSIQFTSIMGWSFSDNLITRIDGGYGGFVIHTKNQVFGFGRCVTFGCLNFQQQTVYFSPSVYFIKWGFQEFRTGASASGSFMFKKFTIVPVFSPPEHEEQYEETQEQNSNTTVVKSNTIPKWATPLGVFLGVDIIAGACIYLIYRQNKLNKLPKPNTPSTANSSKVSSREQIVIPKIQLNKVTNITQAWGKKTQWKINEQFMNDDADVGVDDYIFAQ
ncbi:Conserved_hypothetical protein [Hexamita inflata]|uniref:Uncharacterized protein n=1 Tax=Hexamita inflata TaxID=28002 RepID=A0AA86PWL7_9EUKA|nr:Conserved hypothetical protein [Hexamita inflata]